MLNDMSNMASGILNKYYTAVNKHSGAEADEIYHSLDESTKAVIQGIDSLRYFKPEDASSGVVT